MIPNSAVGGRGIFAEDHITDPQTNRGTQATLPLHIVER